MRLSTPTLLLGLAAVHLLAAAPSAHASPWTLRRGEIAVVAGFDYQWARDEFLDERGADQPFPLNGRYRATTLNLGLRAGFTDRFELELQVPFKLVSYTSDTVILLEPPMPTGSDLDFYQENVIDLSRTRQGIGDIWFTGRYNLARWPVAVAIEGRLKTPTGYDGPAGTFGDDPQTAEAFLDGVGELVTPENVEDDVVLGDGQVDLNLNLLLGASLPSRTFFRLDAGYNLRLGGAGDQILASVKVGQAVSDRVLFYADARVAYTVTDGDVIGISVAAIDPTLPNTEYGGTNNLLLREVPLERDAIDIAVGAILKITDAVEMNVAYARTLWGRNTAEINAIYVAFGVRTQLVEEEAETSAPAEEEAYEDEAYEEGAPEDGAYEEGAYEEGAYEEAHEDEAPRGGAAEAPAPAAAPETPRRQPAAFEAASPYEAEDVSQGR